MCSWSHVTRSGHTNEVRSRVASRSHQRNCVSALSFPTAGSFQPVRRTRTEDHSHASATRLRATQKPSSSSCALHACRSEVVSYNHTHIHTHTRAHPSITIEMSLDYCNITYTGNYPFFFSCISQARVVRRSLTTIVNICLGCDK